MSRKKKSETVGIVQMPKPRNPLALRARQLNAGAHRKSTSAVRQEQQRDLRKKLTSSEDE